MHERLSYVTGSDNASFWVLVVSLLALLLVWRLRTKALPLPPGPPRHFFVGNAPDLPRKFGHLGFDALCKKYGDIVYLDAFGIPLIILGTQQAALDLLERRSATYSDRRFSVMANLTGFSWFFAVNPYGPKWRKARRAFLETMNPNAIPQYRSVGERAVRRYLLRVLEEPDKYRSNALYMYNATIIAVAYGLDVHAKSENHKYVKIAEQTMKSFHEAFTLGGSHVERFPILRHFPSWFPLAGFKRKLPEWSADARRLRDEPWEAAMTALNEGRATSSMASILTGDANTEEEVTIAKGACASAYAGMYFSMFATFAMFMAAMVLFPETQQRAQAELDSVIGPDRLPDIRDKEQLPYLSALLVEVFRWQPVVPTGVSHLAMEEDEYRGYRIPRGAVIIPNPWAYSRDANLYPDPEEFRPERFLKDGKLELGDLDPSTSVFGYGRRICPGRHFAEEMVFTTIASLLHCFDISGPKDKDGHPVKFELKFMNVSPMLPEEFECNIRPRTEAAESLIRAVCSESELAEMI
ncbi:cytochrome P450 [Lentinus tigrinus ALCF2SS1-7]|uniref:Cytochrome P450 n=1 Tax=Lentinus tigrinus ALCF2SS1-6 TaxID=1328759 RepID=A0A5C2RUE3_9APHY|nr:cytochrome P450 [Lentinus tigrinus ALCF2SS1-6]RPD69154.1 cytochrome P450 [Lentinus tigrinus ALCF2SS1-7]